MKNVKFFVLLCTIVMTVISSFNKVFGQVDQAERKWLAEMDAKGQYGECGNDSIACVHLLSQFSEFCKQQALDKAYPSWSALFNKYPKCSQKIYSDGVKVIKKKMQMSKTGKEQQIWVDTLMLLYDRRIHFFAAQSKLYDEGYILGRKGVDLLKYRKESFEDSYNILNKSIELRGEKSELAVILCAMQATRDMYNAHKIGAEVVKGNYQNYIKLLTAIKNKDSKDANIAATAEQVLNEINSLYSNLNLGDVIASASDNTATTTTQTTNNVSSAATTSTATSNNTSKNNNNTRIGSSEIAAVMIGYLIRGAASTVKDVLDSRGSYSSSSYSSSSSSSDSYSSSSSDLNKMDENQLSDWWRSHKGTKISFEYEDYFSECDGWAKRNYKFIGYVDECQWSEFYVNIISISMLSSGLTTKENDDEVTSCVKRKYIGNHIRIYPSRIYKLTEE